MVTVSLEDGSSGSTGTAEGRTGLMGSDIEVSLCLLSIVAGEIAGGCLAT